MALETADFISQLNESNPVGSSDLVSQGDDHLRLVKKVLRQSFPSISGAVTLSQDDLNALAPIVGGEIPDDWLSANVPLLDQSNTFEAQITEFSNAAPIIRYIETDASADEGIWQLIASNGEWSLRATNDALSAEEKALSVTRVGATIGTVALTADTITLNGVSSSDFARLSQTNVFETQQNITRNGAAFLRFVRLNATGGPGQFRFDVGDDGGILLRSLQAGVPQDIVYNTDVDSNGNITVFDFPSGELRYGGDEVGFRRLVNIQNGNYTLQASDAGHGVAKHSGGAGETWTVPDNTFQTGDVVPLFVLSGPLTVSPGTGMQLFHAGTGSLGSVTIEAPGFASLYFPGPGAAYIGGIGVFPS